MIAYDIVGLLALAVVSLLTTGMVFGLISSATALWRALR